MKALGFIFFPAVSLGVGTLSGYLTRVGLETVYPFLDKSALTPPGWVFPLVWAALYLLMGIGAAMVAAKDGAKRTGPLLLWFLQLGLNFGWSLLFFNEANYLGAMLCLVILWLTILAMTISFAASSRLAAWLQVPYLLWVGFAGYLNAVVWLLN